MTRLNLLLTDRFILAALTVVLAVFAQAAGVSAQGESNEVKEWRLGERILNLGSWGADVFTLQITLRELGYKLDADGLYGEETKGVVSAFQRTYGLEVTGAVGPKTLEALRKAQLAQVETMIYTVQPGDSLWSIARTFDTTMEDIIDLNNLPDRPLRAGEQLKVPALLTYTVKPGDTLWDIARRFHTTMKAIAEMNQMSLEQTLAVGTVLKLPRDAFIVAGHTQ